MSKKALSLIWKLYVTAEVQKSVRFLHVVNFFESQ